MKVSKRTVGNLLLMLTALIWGTAFVAQKKGLDFLPPCTFNGIRTMLGCIALLPLIFFRDLSEKKKNNYQKHNTKTLLLGGLVCGVLLCVAGTSQTYGLVDADAGKSGFITALYLIWVPIISVFVGKKIRSSTVISVILALAGLYFLCVKAGSGFSFNRADMLLFFCAIVFSFHIMAIDYFSPKVDGVKLSCLQFLVSATLNMIVMVVWEKPEISDILACWFPLFYAGVMSCGVAYTLQIIAQKDTDPTVASIIMSMESLFALLAGIAFGEKTGERELLGCALMLVAIILVQLPDKKGIEK